MMTHERSRRTSLGLVAVLIGAAGCVGEIGDGGAGDPPGDLPTEAEANEVGVSGARRLTAIEFRTTVRDLTGVDVVDAELSLPTDDRTPFDNDFTRQTASQALIDGAELVAGEVAGEVVADPMLRSNVVPCEPSGAADEACFRSFVTTFGRRALRRTVSDEEVDAFVAHFMPHAEVESDFWVAVDSAIRAFLQHPEFLYRIEIGEPVPTMAGLYRLNGFEVATRLSYLLLGTTPPDWLLDMAESGELEDPAKLREAATTLLGDAKALDRLERFHAMWLAYESIPLSATITDAMRLETRTLLNRYVLEEKRPWSDLLLSDETFVTGELATHYGLDTPSDPAGGWVGYGDSGRRGLLSHGTFLSAVAKFEDTSPTQRGLLIQTRLFCRTINPPPPDLGVNVDEPPGGPDPNACKEERYTMWQTEGCKGCHQQLEPVGFGLERFDSAGRFRTAEPNKPECSIDGTGELAGVGSFTGPAELGGLMIEAGGVDECVATMVYRFAMGRWELDEHDDALLERLVVDAQAGGGLALDKLVGELVGSEAFRLRREEVAGD
ncbi:MAG: DUF1592 domain-containing protein [Polyangiaceae bacterium]|nr:DUF1592 domain-containing protein [Polyangiaceae bacterium]